MAVPLCIVSGTPGLLIVITDPTENVPETDTSPASLVDPFTVKSPFVTEPPDTAIEPFIFTVPLLDVKCNDAVES
jgi:hypothetical protein